MNINGLYAPKLVRNDILQLLRRFLIKNQFCSKGRWRPSWIFVIFGQTRNASFEIKTGDLHKSFFHLNALKNLVHWRPLDEISEYLLFTCFDGGHFKFCALRNSAHLFRRRLFFDKYLTCQRLVTESWFWNQLLYDF